LSPTQQETYIIRMALRQIGLWVDDDYARRLIERLRDEPR